MVNVPFFVAAAASIFAIVDPIGTVPFFVSLTEGFPEEDKKVVMDRSTLVLAGVLFGFALFGRYIFAAFGFTLDAFEIAGGVLLFFVAYEMLNGQVAKTKLTPADREEALAKRDELSVVPLGIPLLAGPGAISAVMIYEGNAGGDFFLNLSVFVGIAITVAATWLVLRYGARIFKYLGRMGVTVISRVMGLLLAAVGIQFIIDGVFGVIAAH